MIDIQNIKQISPPLPKKQNAQLFSCSTNSGLRIADIRSLDVQDIKDKDYIELREKETKDEGNDMENVITHFFRTEYVFNLDQIEGIEIDTDN